MKLLQGLMMTSLALSLAGCCGGGKSEPSRWEGKAGSGSTPAKTTATATATTPPKPTTTPSAAPTATTKPDDKKTECKKFASGSINKAFPDEADGFKRVFKADKEGYAEAEYTKAKEKLTLTITHSPDKKGEYASVSDKVSGHPYKPFGKNKSNILVKDCYLVAASSMEIDEAKRKTWLGKFNFSALP